MKFKDKLKKEKPWAILGWTRKEWKAKKPWKQARVTEEKMIDFLACLDNETIQKIKDEAQAESLVEQIFKS
jgi:ribosomal protein S25